MKNIPVIFAVLLQLTVFMIGAELRADEKKPITGHIATTPAPTAEQLRQAMQLGMEYQAMMYPPDRSRQGYPIPYAYSYRPQVIIQPVQPYLPYQSCIPYGRYCNPGYPGYGHYPVYPPTYPWPVNRYPYLPHRRGH